MASALSLGTVLGLLLVSALPAVLGDRSSPDFRAYPGDPSQIGPMATEPRRRPPPKGQHERAQARALPVGALYTAAVVVFVLYKCLQVREDEACGCPGSQFPTGTLWYQEQGMSFEQQLVQLIQQLAQTEQHLNNLMAQLDPLFESVTTLAGAQQELLNMKLHTIHQLLQKNKPNKGVEDPESEASIPFPEDFCVKEEEKEAGDSQAWEERLNWSTGTRNLATTNWGVEQGLRRRRSKAAARGPSHSPLWEGGAAADGSVKQSLFL
ncbi:coiled-coil domain-containing protein 107 isoform X1 [Phyllostomus hastatus]|uniref:coiled-coil domain-containing protein 107 isoform X1 n=1 Tax=Phyllostomus hastatus TaxID=9423 RepID=UPI001E6843E0|nr:coiled-coil domain-containing protein 107 isoform X1 [Phyllostomus hastatus]